MLFGITGSKLVLDLGRNIASNNDYNFLYPKSRFEIKIEGEEETEVRTFYFPLKTTIQQVKFILAEAMKTNHTKIELFHELIHLDDEKTLSDYKWPNYVQLTVRFKETKEKKVEKTEKE